MIFLNILKNHPLLAVKAQEKMVIVLCGEKLFMLQDKESSQQGWM